MWRPGSADPLRARLAVAVLMAAAVAGGAARVSVAQERGGAEIFRRMATVLQHPRCMNCHTREGFPRQGDDRHRHTMNVSRGPADRGAPGLHCAACHRSANQAASGVPGAADWHLAPLRMAWEGLSVGELCRALVDPARGGMRPDQFVPHFRTGLVRWAWAPGADSRGRARSQPPMGYEQFMALTQEWVTTGSACPSTD
jgi:hypothetical protein